MTKSHLGSVEVEEVHQLDGLAFLQSAVVDTARFVVQFDVHREDLDVLCCESAPLVVDTANKREPHGSRYCHRFLGRLEEQQRQDP
jgi:hypothetical protein